MKRPEAGRIFQWIVGDYEYTGLKPAKVYNLDPGPEPSGLSRISFLEAGNDPSTRAGPGHWKKAQLEQESNFIGQVFQVISVPLFDCGFSIGSLYSRLFHSRVIQYFKD